MHNLRLEPMPGKKKFIYSKDVIKFSKILIKPTHCYSNVNFLTLVIVLWLYKKNTLGFWECILNYLGAKGHNAHKCSQMAPKKNNMYSLLYKKQM